MALNPSSPKPYILNFPNCHFGAVSQSYLKCYLPSCSPHLTPNKKLNSQPSSCTFFFFFSRHCYAHFFKIHCVEICFNYFLVYIYDQVADPYGNCMFTSLRDNQTLPNSPTFLWSPRQLISILVVQQLCQHLVLSDFQILLILVGI